MSEHNWKRCWKKQERVEYREQVPGERYISTREGLTPLLPDEVIIRWAQEEEYNIGRADFERNYTTKGPDAEVERLRLALELIKVAEHKGYPIAYATAIANAALRGEEAR